MNDNSQDDDSNSLAHTLVDAPSSNMPANVPKSVGSKGGSSKSTPKNKRQSSGKASVKSGPSADTPSKGPSGYSGSRELEGINTSIQQQPGTPPQSSPHSPDSNIATNPVVEGDD